MASFFRKIGSTLEKAAEDVRAANTRALNAAAGVLRPIVDRGITPLVTAPGRIADNVVAVTDVAANTSKGLSNSLQVAANQVAERSGSLVDKASNTPTILIVAVVAVAALFVAPILLQPKATASVVGNTASTIGRIAGRGLL